jgi:hypothetical protein
MKTAITFALVLWGAGAFNAVAGEAAPKTPGECRQRVLAEIERFRKMQRPDDLGGGDEHVAKVTLWHFQELKDETTLILAFTGDKDAVSALVKQYGLEQPSLQRWIEDRHIRYPKGPVSDRALFQVAQIMDIHRPDLARKMRDEMRRLATIPEDAPARVKLNLDRMSLKELRQAAQGGDEEALRRWACLDREDATPFLLQLMDDNTKSPRQQQLAAEALATCGDQRGLNWLRKMAPNHSGTWAGTSLLRAGETGQNIYFDLVQEHEKAKKDLPTHMLQAPLELSTELFCKLLPRLMQTKDLKLRYHVDHALLNHRLPADTLSYLIDQVRKDDRKESFLVDDLCGSIMYNGVQDLLARDVARLWAEELLKAEAVDKWECGAKLFLLSGLGSKEIAATSARRQIEKSTNLAAQVLAEAGRAEDAPLIWAATHRPLKDAMTRNWYAGPSLGWLATVRLTTHPAKPQ